MQSRKTNTEENYKRKSGMLPSLRGMFICPEAIQSFGDNISDFSFTEFFEWMNLRLAESQFHERMPEKSKARMMDDPGAGLFVF